MSDLRGLSPDEFDKMADRVGLKLGQVVCPLNLHPRLSRYHAQSLQTSCPAPPHAQSPVVCAEDEGKGG